MAGPPAFPETRTASAGAKHSHYCFRYRFLEPFFQTPISIPDSEARSPIPTLEPDSVNGLEIRIIAFASECVSQNRRRPLLCVRQQCRMWDLLLAAERQMLCWMFRTSLSSEKYQLVPIQGGCSRLSQSVLILRETGS